MEIKYLEHNRVKIIFDISGEEYKKSLGEIRKNPVAEEDKDISESDRAINNIFKVKIKEMDAHPEITTKVISEIMPSLETPIDEEKGFKIAISLDLQPDFELPQYIGLEVKGPNVKVSEEEVQDSLEAALNEHKTFVDVKNDTISNGNRVTFDFIGKVDGVAFDGGSANDYQLVVGSHQFIPGFEEQMVGLKKGDVKDITVKFPDDYQAKNLAGKDSVFTLKIKKIEEEKLTELNDEFVKSLKLDGVSTVPEYKNYLKDNLLKEKEAQEKERMINDLFEQICANTVVDCPLSLLDNISARMKQQYVQQAQMYGMEFNQFLMAMGLDEEKFNKIIEENSKKQCVFSLVLGKIAEKEKITPTKDELNAYVEKVNQKEYGLTNEEFIKQYGAQVIQSIAYEKVTDFVLKNAKIK